VYLVEVRSTLFVSAPAVTHEIVELSRTERGLLETYPRIDVAVGVVAVQDELFVG